MKKLIFSFLALTLFTSLSSRTQTTFWSLNENWETSESDARFGPDDVWQAWDFDTINAMPEQDVNDTINYGSVVVRGYANRGAFVFKFYDSFGSPTLVENPVDIPVQNPDAGVIDAGDVATMEVPGEHAMIVWTAPRDMVIKSQIAQAPDGTVYENLASILCKSTDGGRS